MKPKIIDLHQARIEQSLLKMSEKIATAIELSHKAKDLSAHSETLLIRAHQDLEELYLSVDSPCESEK